ncbi:TPA_asm: UL53 iORF RNA |nr:TPA_asm: UL53 iORF RNA \
MVHTGASGGRRVVPVSGVRRPPPTPMYVWRRESRPQDGGPGHLPLELRRPHRIERVPAVPLHENYPPALRAVGPAAKPGSVV